MAEEKRHRVRVRASMEIVWERLLVGFETIPADVEVLAVSCPDSRTIEFTTASAGFGPVAELADPPLVECEIDGEARTARFIQR